MNNVKSTLLSQYDNSPVINQLVHGTNAAVDPAPDIVAFYDAVFNVLSATGWGLDQWGKIVNIGRTLNVQAEEALFGFAGSGLQPFGQGTFVNGGLSTTTYTLTDAAYRELILLKAAANLSDCSLPSLNRLLQQLYADRGNMYVIETGPMTIRYVFEFYLKPYERALMQREDIPPKPAGVGYEVFEVDPATTFGFAGSGLQPFNQGTFLNAKPVAAYTV